jgi:hypothetical protein
MKRVQRPSGMYFIRKFPLATGKSHGILEIKKGGDDSRTLSHILIEVQMSGGIKILPEYSPT